MPRILNFTVALGWLALAAIATAADEGRLEIHAVDKTTGQPIAARMHLKDARGKIDQAAESAVLEGPFCLRRHDRAGAAAGHVHVRH